MSRSRFRLEALLGHRRRQEDVRKLALGEAERRHLDALAEAQELRRRREHAAFNVAARRNGGVVLAAKLHDDEVLLIELGRQIERQEEQAENLAADVRERRAELAEAVKARRASNG